MAAVPISLKDMFSEAGFFVKKYLFLFLLLILAITFFARNNYRSVKDISPELLAQPRQQKAGNAPLIRFKKGGYSFELTPLYDYEVSGLIVSKMNYKIFSLGKFEKVFPYDLCMIWGSNVSGGLYKNNSLKFSQDCRWCYVQWFGDVSLNWEEFSNNHLLISDPAIERKAGSLVVGDQVNIKGQLVNVKATLISKPDIYDASEYAWNSGVEKSGSGAGACKVIYVQDINILKKANVVASFLFRVSFYGLIILIIYKLFNFFKLSRP